MNVRYMTSNRIGKIDSLLLQQLPDSVLIEQCSRQDNLITSAIQYLHGIRKDWDVVSIAGTSLAPLAWLSKSPTVVTVHDPPSLYSDSYLKETSSSNVEYLIRSGLSKMLPRALADADGLVAISPYVKSELVGAGFNPEKITVVPWGVDTDHYCPIDQASSRETLNLPPEESCVLAVGSNINRKRWDLIQEVMTEINKYRDVSLIKAGYGEEKHWDDIRVHNTGYIEERNMPHLYNSADVFITTSDYEGFGMPVLEAMACGVNIVATNGGAIPEVLGPGGTLIKKSRPDFVSRFADAVRSTLNSNQNERGRSRAMQFTWDRTANGYMSVWNEVSDIHHSTESEYFGFP